MKKFFFVFYAIAGAISFFLGIYQGIALGGGFPYLPPFLGIEGLVGGLMASLLPVAGIIMLIDAGKSLRVAEEDEPHNEVEVEDESDEPHNEVVEN